jgi:hypothetical protein
MKFFRDNGLTIVLALLSALTIGGMFLTGWSVFNHELTEHGAFVLHLRYSAEAENAEAIIHGEPTTTMLSQGFKTNDQRS